MDSHDVARLARAVQMVSFVGETAPPWLRDELAAGIGGVCLFAVNLAGDDQVAALTAELHAANPAAAVAIDEEGGDVTRLDRATGSDLAGAAALGVVDDLDATRAVYATIGRRLRALGIDLDLAPVADVNVAAGNPVIGVRSFGRDAGLVARHVRAAVDGLQSVGVAACLKHFPGHGATVADSHQALPVVDADEATLRARELAPFAATAATAVMSAHLVVRAFDDRPATTSRRVLDLLRADLGFAGAVVSDALDMAGVHGHGVAAGDVTPAMIGRAAVAALAAGCDVVCLGSRQGPDVPAAVTAAITAAVEAGDLAADRLVEAARRAATLRAPALPPGGDDDAAAADARLAATVAARALRTSGQLPALRAAVVVELRAAASMANYDVAWSLGDELAALDPAVSTLRADAAADVAELLAAAAGRPLVVVVRAAAANPWQLRVLSELAAQRPDLVSIELGWPRDPDRPDLPGAASVATFGASRASLRAAAALLAGRL